MHRGVRRGRRRPGRPVQRGCPEQGTRSVRQAWRKRARKGPPPDEPAAGRRYSSNPSSGLSSATGPTLMLVRALALPKQMRRDAIIKRVIMGISMSVARRPIQRRIHSTDGCEYFQDILRHISKYLAAQARRPHPDRGAVRADRPIRSAARGTPRGRPGGNVAFQDRSAD